MQPHLVYPEEIDRRLEWSFGTAARLARRRKLPHYMLPDGSIRLLWSEVENLVRRVPADAAGQEGCPTTNDAQPEQTHGLTAAEVARRYRVSPDKVRAWIARGELPAVNTAAKLCGRPRWVVLPDALAAFEKRRASGPVPKPPRRRRSGLVDFYPD